MSEDAPEKPAPEQPAPEESAPATPDAAGGGGSLFPVIVLLALCGAAVIGLLSLGNGQSAAQDPATANEVAEALAQAERLLQEARDPGEALVYLERVLEIDPDHVHANVLTGAALISLRQSEEALEYLDHAYELAPEDLSVLRHRALVLQDLQRWKDARPMWEQVLKQVEAQGGDPSTARLQLATNAMFAAELETAVEHLEAYLALHDDNAIAYQMYSDALGGLGRRDDSIAAMERVVAIVPRHMPTRHQLQSKAIAYRGFDAVLEAAQAKADAEGADAPAHYLYARLLARVPGETDHARAEYDLALDLDPELYWAIEGVAQLDLRQGRAADAVPRLVHALELAGSGQRPDPFFAGRVRLAAAQRALGDYDAALELLQPLLNQDGYAYTAAIEYLGCFLDAGRLDEALAFARAQATGKPADAQQAILLAVTYRARQEPDELRGVLEAALGAQPEGSGWRFQLALADLEQGRLEEARAAFAAVLKDHPEDRPLVPYLAFWAGYAVAESDPELARARWARGRDRARVWPDAFWVDACGRALGDVDAEALAQSAELEAAGERNHGPFVEGFVRELAGATEDARALYQEVLDRARHGGQEWPAGLARARLEALDKD